jgi:hypothetical protein
MGFAASFNELSPASVNDVGGNGQAVGHMEQHGLDEFQILKERFNVHLRRVVARGAIDGYVVLFGLFDGRLNYGAHCIQKIRLEIHKANPLLSVCTPRTRLTYTSAARRDA